MNSLDKYSIVHRIAENIRRDEYNALRKLGADALLAHIDAWAAYNDFMRMAFNGEWL